MKLLLHKVTVLFLLLFLFCINERNPFSPSNAKIVVESKSFVNGDKVPIFCSETLYVAPYVSSSIDSFTLQAVDNRLWSNGDTTIRNYGTLKNAYTFHISFYDTGYKEISITTFRTGATPHNDNFFLYAYSPLHQDPVTGYTKDTVTLQSVPVHDDKVLYHWNFANTITITSLSHTLDTNFLLPSSDTIGMLYVTDLNSQHQSPYSLFTFSIIDTIKPTIRCVNSGNINKDTIKTGDSIFVFKVQIFDQDTFIIAVDSASIDEEPFDLYYKTNNIYLKFIDDMYTFQHTPKEVAVYACDNKVSQNAVTKTFWLFYDSTEIQTSGVEIYVDDITDTTITANPTYTISGSVINSTKDSVILEIAVNNVIYDIKHTIAVGDSTWFWILSLTEGYNTVVISAKDRKGTVLEQKKVTIYHDPDINDITGPVIWEIYVNNQTGSPVYVTDTNPEIRVVAFDVHSEIAELSINSIPVNPEADGITYQTTIKAERPPEDVTISIAAKDLYNNSTNTTISVIKNTLPVVMRDHFRNPVLRIGIPYKDTIFTSDKEPDYAHVNFLIQGPWEEKDRILSFTPDSTHIGKDSIQFQIYDGFQYTPVHTWHYEVIDTIAPDSVKFSANLAKKLPQWIIAGKDSIELILEVTGGTPPFWFSATIPSLDTILLDNTTKDSLSWKPDTSDVGPHVLTMSVTDSLQTSDALFHAFTVLPQNSDECSLSYVVDPDSILVEGLNDIDTLDLSDSATATVAFTIHDSDNPLTESHTVTYISSDETSTFPIDSLNDSLQFEIIIEPEVNKDDEQILVQVTDSDNNTSARIFYVMYPKYCSPEDIDNLIFWFDASDREKVLDINGMECQNDGDEVGTWINKAPGGNDVSKGAIPPEYYTNPPAIRFTDGGDAYLANNYGGWPDHYFSIFIIAKLESIEEDDNYPLLASNEVGSSFNIGVTNNCVGAFTDTTEYFSPKLQVVENSLYLFSYKSSRLRNSELVVGLNGQSDTLVVDKKRYDELRVGANTSSEGWDGDIAEIIIFRTAISDKNHAGLEKYVEKKYGIAISK